MDSDDVEDLLVELGVGFKTRSGQFTYDPPFEESDDIGGVDLSEPISPVAEREFDWRRHSRRELACASCARAPVRCARNGCDGLIHTAISVSAPEREISAFILMLACDTCDFTATQYREGRHSREDLDNMIRPLQP